jgi:hypothetical protein
MTWTPGWRSRRVATYSSDGSTAVTRPGPTLGRAPRSAHRGGIRRRGPGPRAGVRRNRRRAPPAVSRSGP